MSDVRPPEWTIRPANGGDFRFLVRMLGHAAAWRPGTTTPQIETVLAIPELARYIAGWPRATDYGLIAEQRRPIGAAWWRLMTADNPGYGYVGEDIPEVAMAVDVGWRGHGIGTALLTGLIAAAAGRGLRMLSLSVDRENPAVHMYARSGFTTLGNAGNPLTMTRQL
jgi:GNAT superfamily N-acetyltransferase